jgi:hypothetical protein
VKRGRDDVTDTFSAHFQQPEDVLKNDNMGNNMISLFALCAIEIIPYHDVLSFTPYHPGVLSSRHVDGPQDNEGERSSCAKMELEADD